MTFLLSFKRNALLLSDDLAPDAVLAVEAAQHHRRDEFVGKAAVEERAALLECAACPELQGLLRQQEVVMLLCEDALGL